MATESRYSARQLSFDFGRISSRPTILKDSSNYRAWSIQILSHLQRFNLNLKEFLEPSWRSTFGIEADLPKAKMDEDTSMILSEILFLLKKTVNETIKVRVNYWLPCDAWMELKRTYVSSEHIGLFSIVNKLFNLRFSELVTSGEGALEEVRTILGREKDLDEQALQYCISWVRLAGPHQKAGHSAEDPVHACTIANVKIW